MHFLTVFWKLLFALVPPADYFNGWACFVVSISVIGLLTAFIGDLASHFGCTVGLKDSVTAVVFVALGTSVPGASRFHVHYFMFNWPRLRSTSGQQVQNLQRLSLPKWRRGFDTLT